jgi:hypothetical protein
MRIKAVDVGKGSIPGFANGRFTYAMAMGIRLIASKNRDTPSRTSLNWNCLDMKRRKKSRSGETQCTTTGIPRPTPGVWEYSA